MRQRRSRTRSNAAAASNSPKRYFPLRPLHIDVKCAIPRGPRRRHLAREHRFLARSILSAARSPTARLLKSVQSAFRFKRNSERTARRLVAGVCGCDAPHAHSAFRENFGKL
jgi:hypothetical protein